MSIESGTAHSALSRLHQERLTQIESDPSSVVVLCFNEALNDSDVTKYASRLEENLFSEGEKKGVIRRIVSIVIEALQNMKLHSSEDENGKQLGGFCMSRKAEKYSIVFMNIAELQKAERVSERLGRLNAMDAPTIKAHYMEVMTNGERSDKGGAGLGLITMVMKSKNKVDLAIHEIDNAQCIMSTKVTINRA